MGEDRHPPILKHFAANLRAQRARRRWTQERFAEETGFSARFVQRLERGTTMVTIVTLDRVARALGVSPGSLLKPAKLARAKAGRPRKNKDDEKTKAKTGRTKKRTSR